jgi:hypothetical protein
MPKYKIDFMFTYRGNCLLEAESAEAARKLMMDMSFTGRSQYTTDETCSVSANLIPEGNHIVHPVPQGKAEPETLQALQDLNQ